MHFNAYAYQKDEKELLICPGISIWNLRFQPMNISNQARTSFNIPFLPNEF